MSVSLPDEVPPRHRVLLVDDDPELLTALGRSLSPRFEVVTAASGAEALHVLETAGPFAVLVSDYEMPIMDGTELLALVHERWPETIGIMLTGEIEVDVAIRALHSGRIRHFLEKPCRQGELQAAVEECAKEHGRQVRARLYEGELEFSRDALWDFNAALTSRIKEQTQSLRRLNRFVSELNSAESLEQIATLAADATSGLMQQRAVQMREGI